jgi:ubiquinone/menaquinone biosynthesis C-methylase UbiE
MSSYYQGKNATTYNSIWRTFNERTLAAAFAQVDIEQLQAVAQQAQRPLRVLDVACGTGLLLNTLLSRLPEVEAYGVDASADMLTQARQQLQYYPHVQLQQAMVGTGDTAGLPYAAHSFDLITCTNVMHNLPDPKAVLQGLANLLIPAGQLVLEDFAQRNTLFWPLVEWLIRRFDPWHVRGYTVYEARALCKQAGFVTCNAQMFDIDWLWHGWVLRSTRG